MPGHPGANVVCRVEIPAPNTGVECVIHQNQPAAGRNAQAQTMTVRIAMI